MHCMCCKLSQRIMHALHKFGIPASAAAARASMSCANSSIHWLGSVPSANWLANWSAQSRSAWSALYWCTHLSAGPCSTQHTCSWSVTWSGIDDDPSLDRDLLKTPHWLKIPHLQTDLPSPLQHGQQQLLARLCKQQACCDPFFDQELLVSPHLIRSY